MDLHVLLDLVVKLRRQPAHASLAGTRARDRNRDPLAAIENHVVSRHQRRIDFFGDFVALALLLGEFRFDLLDLTRDLFLAPPPIRCARSRSVSLSSLIFASRGPAPSIITSSSPSIR